MKNDNFQELRTVAERIVDQPDVVVKANALLVEAEGLIPREWQDRSPYLAKLSELCNLLQIPQSYREPAFSIPSVARRILMIRLRLIALQQAALILTNGDVGGLLHKDVLIYSSHGKWIMSTITELHASGKVTLLPRGGRNKQSTDPWNLSIPATRSAEALQKVASVLRKGGIEDLLGKDLVVQYEDGAWRSATIVEATSEGNIAVELLPGRQIIYPDTFGVLLPGPVHNPV